MIYLGQRAQEVIAPFLGTDLRAYLFSPTMAESERRERLRSPTKTPLDQANSPATTGDPASDSAGKNRLIGGAFSPAPDYVAVMQGHNDSGSSDASVTAAVTAWIGAVRAAAPVAKILVIVEFDGIKRAAVTAGLTAAGDPRCRPK